MNAHRLGSFLSVSEESAIQVSAGFVAWPTPVPVVTGGGWDIYRMAYDQACAALRPSLIDRAMMVHAN